MPSNQTRVRRLFAATFLLAAVSFLLPGCEWDGHFTLLGYTTRPNYDTRIRTVRVPMFKNNTFYRGLEFELTQAIVREIELKTPYKVVNGDGPADSELTGTIISYNKNILNRNQLNEVREMETVLSAEVVWRDLRTGDILSLPQRRPGTTPAAPPPGSPVPLATSPIGPPTMPLPGAEATLASPAEPPPPDVLPPAPVLVQSIAGFIPELGQSITTARQANVNRMAVQIVSMMEKPW